MADTTTTGLFPSLYSRYIFSAQLRNRCGSFKDVPPYLCTTIFIFIVLPTVQGFSQRCRQHPCADYPPQSTAKKTGPCARCSPGPAPHRPGLYLPQMWVTIRPQKPRQYSLLVQGTLGWFEHLRFCGYESSLPKNGPGTLEPLPCSPPWAGGGRPIFFWSHE